MFIFEDGADDTTNTGEENSEGTIVDEPVDDFNGVYSAADAAKILADARKENGEDEEPNTTPKTSTPKTSTRKELLSKGFKPLNKDKPGLLTNEATGESFAWSYESETYLPVAKADIGSLPDTGVDPAKGVTWEAVLATLTPEAKSLLTGLKADYTKKTMELANQRKALLENPATKKILTRDPAAKAPEIDMFDPASSEAYIQHTVEERLAALLKPMQEEYEQQQALNDYQVFVGTHPELNDKTFKTEVYKLMKADDSMDLESAYWRVHGKSLSTKQETLAQENTRLKEMMAKAGMQIGNGREADVNDMEETDALSIYQQLAALERAGKLPAYK